MNDHWFLIVNPISGNGSSKKNWNVITRSLKKHDIHFSFVFTEYSKHETILVQQAIKNGFTKIISVGGDGTLHHVVNGIMSQNIVESTAIQLAVIPIGTGNDWVKTYNIPTKIDKSIAIIKKNNTLFQDIAKIELENNEIFYANNLAGIGYDGYVTNKLDKLKRFGAIAYLLSGLAGLLLYKKSKFKIEINNKVIETVCLMTLFGICKYSGGGMKLTAYKSSTDGLFDVTIAKNLSLLDFIFNLPRLYNGKIVHHKKVLTYKTNTIKITPLSKENIPFIEADGEVIGKGAVKATIITKAIQFIVP
ncbi:MAG: diacylglycerol kinase family lipid kinase [Flavobacteriaceae bacterium]|nr:diacylglycerol kinase family lipid kinase [Flavobacteriaceae bacterium]